MSALMAFLWRCFHRASNTTPSATGDLCFLPQPLATPLLPARDDIVSMVSCIRCEPSQPRHPSPSQSQSSWHHGSRRMKNSLNPHPKKDCHIVELHSSSSLSRGPRRHKENLNDPGCRLAPTRIHLVRSRRLRCPRDCDPLSDLHRPYREGKTSPFHAIANLRCLRCLNRESPTCFTCVPHSWRQLLGVLSVLPASFPGILRDLPQECLFHRNAYHLCPLQVQQLAMSYAASAT